MPSPFAPPLPGEPGSETGTTLGDLIGTMWDNLGENGYQTGTAVIFATVAIVALVNIKAKPYISIPVAIGAFWAGWLAWNTFTRQSNPLFPGDVQALELWDVAFQSDTAFLGVVIVACVAAVFVWRKAVGGIGKVAVVLGVVLGASFVYNVVQSVRGT
jgi:hypothetical protein